MSEKGFGAPAVPLAGQEATPVPSGDVVSRNPSLRAVMQALYHSEINCGVSCFWDVGWDVWLGDDMNGVSDKTNVDYLAGAARWLRDAAIRRYPDSSFAKLYRGMVEG